MWFWAEIDACVWKTPFPGFSGSPLVPKPPTADLLKMADPTLTEVMTELSNIRRDVLAEVASIRRQVDRIVRNLPTLAAANSDADLKREMAVKDQRRKADISQITRGRK